MSGIFLSYGRGDDEPFVRRLYERLVAKGHDVWFDRECMPSRALTFLQEIRDAVRGRDRTLVVIGPAAVVSDYVRAEWQAALVEGKVVTPVLRLGDFDLLPAELRNLHCPDLRATRNARAGWAELTRVLAQPVPPLGGLLGGVPELPPHFQPRPDALTALAEHLLYDVEHPAVIDGPLRTTVLHGMGGVGKSVLASAFARSTTTRRVFGDGVAWVGAARDLAPLDLLRPLLGMLSAPLPAGAGLDDAVTALRDRLDGRRCLIVVDNVWSIEVVEPVAQALSTVARMLVTTRDAALATGLGARACPLDVLTPEAALRQLADWAGRGVDALPAQAAEVARECGFLPFALALQGALVRDGVSWDDLLGALRESDIDFAEQRFASYPYPTVLAALRVSVDALRAGDARAAAALERLSAFVWDDGVPEAAVARLWGHGLDAVGERDARKRLVQMERKSLLRLEGEAPSRRVLLHDLMRDYLVATTDVSANRRALLAAYRAACAGDWTDGPDDGYFLEHLLDHLAVIDDGGAELNRVLVLETPAGRHALWERCDAAGCGEALRRQLVRRLTDPGADLASVLGLALLLASATVRSTRLPAPMLAALVQHGLWTAQRALDDARQRPVEPPEEEETGRVAALLALLPWTDGAQRAEVLDEAWSAVAAADDAVLGAGAAATLAGALAAAGRVNDALAVTARASHGDERTSALAAVMDHVDEAKRAELLEQALDDCATTLDLFRPAALEPLLRWLDPAGVRAAHREAVAELANAMARGWCEAMLVQRLVDLRAIEPARALARSILDPQSRAEALAGVAPHLGEAERSAAVAAVLATAEALDDARWRQDVADAFSDMPEPLGMIVPIMFAGRSWRADALGPLLPHLSGETAARALALLDGIAQAAVAEPDPLERMRAIVALPPSLRDEHLDAALAAAAAIESAADRRSALETLAPALQPRHREAALAVVAGLPDADERIPLLEMLVPLLDAGTLPAAQALAGAIGDQDDLVLAAAACATAAESATLRTLLHAAGERDEYVRARALALLAPALDAEAGAEAQAMLDGIDDPGSLAEVALPAFARRAAGPQRDALLRRAIDAAASMTDPERRAWAFEAFIDLLSPPQLEDALAAFERTEPALDGEWRAFGRSLILALALPRLPAPRAAALGDEVLALAAALPEADLRRTVLAHLTDAGEGGDLERMVEIVEVEPDPYERAMTAGFLVGDVPPALRPRLVAAALRDIEHIDGDGFQSQGARMEAAAARVLPFIADPAEGLRLAAGFDDAGWRAVALLQFARQPSLELFDPVLHAVSGIADPGDRARALVDLASRAPEAARAGELLAEAFEAALADHSDLLHDSVLAPLAAALVARPATEVGALFTQHRRRLGEMTRAQLLAKLHGLAPALAHADPAAAAAVPDAVLRVGRWWP